MRALIDADLFKYEIGAVGQYKDENTGEIVYRSFDWVAETIDNRIRDICQAVESTEPPTLYLTADRWTAKRIREDYIPNFREEVSVSRDYKGNRKFDKPFHFKNIISYLISEWGALIANGCEADDLISIEQFGRRDKEDTIICTRDKDLRQCPGWHYGWEVGKQPEFGPKYYTELGELELVRHPTNNKPILKGGGKAFFFAQLLIGDIVDNIGGLVKAGPVKAYELLSECRTEEEYQSVVQHAYEAVHGRDWMEKLKEQSDLLWIAQERNEDGSLRRYQWPF
jgi:hypothetical protein